MKRIFVPLILLVLAASAVMAADNAPAATNGAPQALAAFLQQTVFPIVGTFVLGVISVFINRLGKKFHIDALTQKDNLLERLAYQGITLAEEKAASLLGSKSALTGNDKLDIAVAHILNIMPKVSEDQARAIAQSLLARIPGLGATGDSTYTLDSSGLIGITAPTIQNSNQPAPAAS